ncbi:MAG: peptide deformylase [Patescibacteria group bacterium]
MSILTIVIESEVKNPILRARSEEVADILNTEIQNLIEDMQDTLAIAKNGIGIAAPQVGRNLRIFVVSSALGLNQVVFINPVITKISEKAKLMDEGCLSVLGLYGKIKRAESLKIEAYNQNGRKFKMKADGLVAQLFQHEIDHLNGILFKDKAESITNHEL